MTDVEFKAYMLKRKQKREELKILSDECDNVFNEILKLIDQNEFDSRLDELHDRHDKIFEKITNIENELFGDIKNELYGNNEIIKVKEISNEEISNMKFKKRKIVLQKTSMKSKYSEIYDYTNEDKKPIIIRNLYIKYKFNDDFTDEEKEFFDYTSFVFTIFIGSKYYIYEGSKDTESYLLQNVFNDKKNELTKIYPIMFLKNEYTRCNIRNIKGAIPKEIMNKFNSICVKYEYVDEDVSIKNDVPITSRIFYKTQIQSDDSFIMVRVSPIENQIDKIILKNNDTFIHVDNYKIHNYVICIPLDNKKYIDSTEIKIYDENNNIVRCEHIYIIKK